MNKQDKMIILLEAIERHLDFANVLYSNKEFKILESINAKLDVIITSIDKQKKLTKKLDPTGYPYIFPGDCEVNFGGGVYKSHKEFIFTPSFLNDFFNPKPKPKSIETWIAYIDGSKKQIGKRDLGKIDIDTLRTTMTNYGPVPTLTLPTSSEDRAGVKRIEVYDSAIDGNLLVWWEHEFGNIEHNRRTEVWSPII